MSIIEDLLRALMYSEAGGELNPDVMRQVGSTVLNRAEDNKSYWGGTDPIKVMSMPGQYYGYTHPRMGTAMQNPESMNDMEKAEYFMAGEIAKALLNNPDARMPGHYFIKPSENPAKKINLARVKNLGMVGPYNIYEEK